MAVPFKRRCLKILAVGFIGIMLCFGVAVGTLYMTGARADRLPPLQNGDIIFRSGMRWQALAILMASSSPYTHMGIIKIEKGREPVVVEAVGPVREILLTRWINGGIGKRITIKRVDGLTAEQAGRALAAAKKLYGRPYDVFFMPGKEAIYCSELIYDAFRDGPKITLGKMEKLKDLNINNPPVRKLIKQRWEAYPECRKQKVSSYEDCLAIIYEQKLVTPASIADDPRMRLVYSNYGFEKNKPD